MKIPLLITCCLGAVSVANAQVEVLDSALYRDPKRELTILQGKLQLPAAGLWTLRPLSPEAALQDIFLQPPPSAEAAALGRRYQAVQRQQQNQERVNQDAHKVDSSQDDATVAHYTLLARLARAGSMEQSLALSNSMTGQALEAKWNWDGAQSASKNQAEEWMKQRAAYWQFMARQGDAPIFRYWLQGGEDRESRRGRPGSDARATTVFQVLGGRAAVRETLQLQALAEARAGRAEEATIPIAQVKGVEVKSHPYEEMLGKVSPGRLPLADLAPADRLLVYVAKPAGLSGLLDGGPAFLNQLGATATGNQIQYDLKDRYYRLLGISQEWVRAVLDSGLVQELGLILPDLFLTDGSDLTVVVRVKDLTLLRPVLQLLGLGGLGQEIQERAQPGGSTSNLAMRRDLLLFSTSRNELQEVLRRHDDAQSPSLGRSAEFRYMLSQLPAGPQTRAYLYLSDPFIRRLVGPEVKIAQLRRLMARADLERISSAALLYRLEGHTGMPTLPDLVRLGYLPPRFSEGDCTLGTNLVAASATYGTPASMTPLTRMQVDMITPQERSAYEQYRDSYSRFWRQFFDPIAIRLDEGGPGQFQLTTFILPLVDSTIYSGLRRFIQTHESQAALNIPALNPTPVLLLSLNLAEEQWVELGRNFFGPSLSRFTTISPAVLEVLGPGLHLAVEDADPVIALGSGDLLGAFGGNINRMAGSELLIIPILLSFVTRPCTILLEVQKPEAVLDLLKQAAAVHYRPEFDDEVRGELYRVEGRDAWIYQIEFFNVITLRLGLELKDRFLLLSNLPWQPKFAVPKTFAARHNGARLQLNPGAIEKQLPALFAASAQQQRQIAMNGIACLEPLSLALRKPSAPAAQQLHKELFGFYPVHPAGGEWIWQDGAPRSTTFGSMAGPMLPDYPPGHREFGLLAGIQNLSLSLQLEDGGLRTTLEWTLKPAKK